MLKSQIKVFTIDPSALFNFVYGWFSTVADPDRAFGGTVK